jgi:hypothetical protein
LKAGDDFEPSRGYPHASKWKGPVPSAKEDRVSQKENTLKSLTKTPDGNGDSPKFDSETASFTFCADDLDVAVTLVLRLRPFLPSQIFSEADAQADRRVDVLRVEVAVREPSPHVGHPSRRRRRRPA